jgi:hypothetical protein
MHHASNVDAATAWVASLSGTAQFVEWKQLPDGGPNVD